MISLFRISPSVETSRLVLFSTEITSLTIGSCSFPVAGPSIWNQLVRLHLRRFLNSSESSNHSLVRYTRTVTFKTAFVVVHFHLLYSGLRSACDYD